MAYFLCTLRGLICTIILTHNTGVSGEEDDLKPIIVFVQQFIKPYISFVRRWVKPNDQTSFGNKSFLSPPFKLQTVHNNTVLTVLGIPPKKRSQEFQPSKPSWTQKKLLSFENRTLMPMPAILRMKSTSQEDIFKKTMPTYNNDWKDVSDNDPFSEKEIASFINNKVNGYVDKDEFNFHSLSREIESNNARNVIDKALNLNIGRTPKLSSNNPQRTISEKQLIPKLAMRPILNDKRIKPRVLEGGYHDVVFGKLNQMLTSTEATIVDEIVLPDLKTPNTHGDDSQEIVFENGEVQLKRAWSDDEKSMNTIYKTSTTNACMYDGKSTRLEIDLGLNNNEQERADLYKAVCPYIYDDKSNPFKSVVDVLNKPTNLPIPTQSTNDELDIMSFINRHGGVTPNVAEIFREVVDVED